MFDFKLFSRAYSLFVLTVVLCLSLLMSNNQIDKYGQKIQSTSIKTLNSMAKTLKGVEIRPAFTSVLAVNVLCESCCQLGADKSELSVQRGENS